MAIFLKDSKSEAPPPVAAPEEAREAAGGATPRPPGGRSSTPPRSISWPAGPTPPAWPRSRRPPGVNKSLIHHHFGSKEALWEEVQGRHMHQYYEAQREMLENAPSTSDLLRDSLIAFFRFLQTDPKSVRFISWSYCAAEPCKTDQEKALSSSASSASGKARPRARSAATSSRSS